MDESIKKRLTKDIISFVVGIKEEDLYIEPVNEKNPEVGYVIFNKDVKICILINRSPAEGYRLFISDVKLYRKLFKVISIFFIKKEMINSTRLTTKIDKISEFKELREYFSELFGFNITKIQ